MHTSDSNGFVYVRITQITYSKKKRKEMTSQRPLKIGDNIPHVHVYKFKYDELILKINN